MYIKTRYAQKSKIFDICAGGTLSGNKVMFDEKLLFFSL